MKNIEELQALLPVIDSKNGATKLQGLMEARSRVPEDFSHPQPYNKPLQLSIGPLNGPMVPLPLEVGICVIGRSPSATVHVTANTVSGLHCLIERWPNGNVTLQDIRSTNGTFRNDIQIPPYEIQILECNQRIVLGGLVALEIIDGS